LGDSGGEIEGSDVCEPAGHGRPFGRFVWLIRFAGFAGFGWFGRSVLAVGGWLAGWWVFQYDGADQFWSRGG
jgi:hypothetical protein